MLYKVSRTSISQDSTNRTTRVLPSRIACRRCLVALDRIGPSARDTNRMREDACCRLGIWQSLELRVHCVYMSA
jgi:hypothetical protein